jgi:hypothetical protein
MGTYLITDNQTGKQYKLTGDSAPSEDEIHQIIGDIGGKTPSSNAMLPSHTPSTAMPDKTMRQTLSDYARPILEGVGVAGGAVLGGAGGGLAGLAGGPAAPGTVPYGAIAGGIAGAGLGYTAGSTLADIVAGKPAPKPGETADKLMTGMSMEAGGQATGPIIKGIAKPIGMVIKPMLGKMSGVGLGGIEEAIKSGTSTGLETNPLASKTTFDKAMRGKITGDEVVENAMSALQTIRDKRGLAYQDKLKNITGDIQNIDIRPIKQDLTTLMQKYNVKTRMDANGDILIDTTRIAMGKTGRKDIKEIISKVSSWGSQPGDTTPLGLDTLKRQLDDFYSDSSQARQFVTSLRNKVKDTITASVPEYGEMTKGYAESTKIIKDIESGLMMRKQGMSGRIMADQTIRRLTSAMKENFALRKELVDVLGKEGEQDISGQIAGYAMRTPIPIGLAGTGPALIGEYALARYLSPKFWPVLAASSPRLQGEFLRMFGKAMVETKRMEPTVGKALGMSVIHKTSE